MKTKVATCSVFIIFIMIGLAVSAPTGMYLGEFTIGESFLDEVILFPDGSKPKVSIIYRGVSGTTILIFIASAPETSNLIAPGYCIVDKKSTATYWYFDFNLGQKDCTFAIQLSTNNRIKIWRY